MHGMFLVLNMCATVGWYCTRVLQVVLHIRHTNCMCGTVTVGWYCTRVCAGACLGLIGVAPSCQQHPLYLWRPLLTKKSTLPVENTLGNASIFTFTLLFLLQFDFHGPTLDHVARISYHKNRVMEGLSGLVGKAAMIVGQLVGWDGID